MQPVRKQPSALLCSLELATASPAVARLAADCFLAGPKGAPQIGQCRVAVLEKGMPFPADCALPWPIWGALHPKISH